MRSHANPNPCYFTVGQLGWHDYDNDRWNEAPDRNSRRSANIWDVHPGDILEIHNILDETVRRVQITPDNWDLSTIGRPVYVWDCTNFEGDLAAYGVYHTNVNGNEGIQFVPDPDVSAPNISNMTTNAKAVTFDLSDEDTSGDIVRMRILQNGIEVARPLFDNFLCAKRHSVDLSFLPAGEYAIEIRAWDGGGNRAVPRTLIDTLPVTPPTAFSANNDFSYFENRESVKLTWTPTAPFRGHAIERRTAGGAWAEIAREIGTDHFYDLTVLGSEKYYYRVRAYEGQYYSDYTQPESVSVLPRKPQNFLAFATLEMGIRTNKVCLEWDAPSLQKPGTISGYLVRRMISGGNAVYFGPYDVTAVCICEDNAYNTPYTFSVRTIDTNSYNSLYVHYDVRTGFVKGCPDSEPNKTGVSRSTISESSGGIMGVYPNPGNRSFSIRYNVTIAGRVSLRIYNISGQLVRTLVDAEIAPSNQLVVWDGKDDNNRDLASGVYFCRLRSNVHASAMKIVLLK